METNTNKHTQTIKEFSWGKNNADMAKNINLLQWPAELSSSLPSSSLLLVEVLALSSFN